MIMMATGAYGQGWTFSMQIKTPGCEGSSTYVSQINALLSGISTMGIPTKSECEAVRQQILAIKVSGPNGNGGTCSVYYTCGECMGSDISGTAGGSVAGGVSINGLAQGLAFFSTHPSSDYENWYNDLLVKFQSMGVDLKGYISGDGLAMPDANFNQGYADQIAEFEKKANNDIITYQKPEQGGVVDLTKPSAFEGKVVDPNKMSSSTANSATSSDAKTSSPDNLTVPIMGGSPTTDEERERNNLYKDMNTMSGYGLDESNFKNEPAPFWTSDQMLEVEKAGVSFAVGAAIALTATASTPFIVAAGTTLLGIAAVDVAFEDIKAVVKANNTGEISSTGQILLESGKSIAKDAAIAAVDMGIGAGVGKIAPVAKEILEIIPAVGTASSAYDIYKAGNK